MKDKAALDGLIAKVEAGSTRWSAAQVKDATGGHHVKLFTEAFHGSLDAAKALHEAVLPDFKYGYDGSIAWVKMPGLCSSYRASIPNGYTARAWLLAILRALLSHAER